MSDIRNGTLGVGELMPGELALVEQLKVSRHTVREALRVLEELGLIVRRQGVGTVVCARNTSPSYVQLVNSPAALLQYPPESRLKVLETEAIKTSRRLARLMHCPAGSTWTRIGALRRLKDTDEPICWTDIYVLPEYAGIARLINRNKRPVYEIIERDYGEQITSVSVDITASILEPQLAERLGVEPGSPSLTLVRRYTGRAQRQFEVSVSQHPAEQFNYTLELKRGWQSGSGWTTA